MSRATVAAFASATALAVIGLLVWTFGAPWQRMLPGQQAPPAAPASSAVVPNARMDARATETPLDSTVPGEVAIDARRQQLIGVRSEPARFEALATEIRAVGTVRYDERRQTTVTTRVDGWIRELYADYEGRPVRAGEPLFTLYSPEILATESEYLLAHRARQQSAGSALEEVRHYHDRLVAAARQRLQLWELRDADIRALEERGEAAGLVTLRAPTGGVLVEKAAVSGMRAAAGEPLLRIADLSTVWVEADVYESDLAVLRLGQRATVSFDAFAGEVFSGRISSIHPSLNEGTRTARARIELANATGRLRPGLYATVTVRPAGRSALTVPLDAVLDSGSRQVVFVAEGDGRFVPRTVTVGRRTADRAEILAGLAAGEAVASGATFFLDSESQLRAGLQNYAPAPVAAAEAAAPAVVIAFRSIPDPPGTGENQFEVALTDAGGQPVTDADVSVQLFMPAMPTMNMPAMQNTTKVVHSGNGVYRGTGQVLMGGRWEATVTVRRGGRPIASRRLALVTR